MAMMGTASRGPNITTSTGISTSDEPVPTTPPRVPAASPSTRTRRYSMAPAVTPACSGRPVLVEPQRVQIHRRTRRM